MYKSQLFLTRTLRQALVLSPLLQMRTRGQRAKALRATQPVAGCPDCAAGASSYISDLEAFDYDSG